MACAAPIRESITAIHPTTSIYRFSKGLIEILQQCREVVYDICPGQSEASSSQYSQSEAPWDASQLYLGRTILNSQPLVIVQFVVAVKDEESGELWDCNAIAKWNQIYITSDGTLRIVAEVLEPNAWVLSRKTDFQNRELPRYAGTLTCMLPADKPLTYTVRLKLLHKTQANQDVELDTIRYFVQTMEPGTSINEQMSGKAVFDIERPMSKLRMSGNLAGDKARAIINMLQDLGDNGCYAEFSSKKRFLFDKLDKAIFADVLLAVRLEESIVQFNQNQMVDCIATCEAVCTDAATSANSQFLLAKAFYITSAVYRQRKDFPVAEEYIERSTQCVEPLAVCEETAVNRYNMGALLAEKAAAEGITQEEMEFAEKCFKDVDRLWKQQKENPSMRDVIRAYNRMIMLFLKSSRQRSPGLRDDISNSDIIKAQKAVDYVERELLARCPKRLEATFKIGMADLFIRRALEKATAVIVTQEDRMRDLERAEVILEEAKGISTNLKMKKEIEGIDDRLNNISDLKRGGLQELNLTIHVPRNGHANGRAPIEHVCFEDLVDALVLSEKTTGQNGRTEQQCSED